MRRISILLVVVGFSLGICQTAAAQENKKTRKTVWEGVYSAAQAERGKAAYGAKCSMCHLADLTGYYGAQGRSFHGALAGKRLERLIREHKLYHAAGCSGNAE